jgi:hypothetical protein
MVCNLKDGDGFLGKEESFSGKLRVTGVARVRGTVFPGLPVK